MKWLSLITLPILFFSSLLSGQTPIPTSTPTPTACNETTGQRADHELKSAILNKQLHYRVYTPPCYSDKQKYPVLYLFHGQSFAEDQWDRLGMFDTADRLITAGEIDPLIIVLPREPDYNLDPRSSKFGQAFLAEILPAVDANFFTIPTRSGRAVGGLSRGAGWAVHLGLANPDLFGSVGAHSLALFPGDINLVSTWRNDTEDEMLPRIYMDDGLQDYLKDSAKKFELRISEYSYPHEWHLNRGSHTETYWQSQVENYLIWYSAGWGELESATKP